MVHSPGRGAWLQANQHGLWTRRLGSSAAWDQLAFLCGSGAIFPSITWPVLVVSLTRQTGSSAMNTAVSFSDARRQVTQQLEDKPGMHLVLVSYDLERHYPGNELVHNGAEFNAEKILWARSKGPKSDLELCQAYSDRTFWSVTTDDKNVSLNPLDLCK